MQLRPMVMSDSDFLLELKNYEETRRYAIATHDEIKKEDHYKWLEHNIQYFQVIEGVAVVRIQDGEISIWVERSRWGKGIATFILDMLSEKDMTSKIVSGNISSMRCFINAGFKPTTYTDGYYIFKK